MINHTDKVNILKSILAGKNINTLGLSTDALITDDLVMMKKWQDTFPGYKNQAIVNVTLSEAKKTFAKLSPKDQHEFSHWAIREAHKDIKQ